MNFDFCSKCAQGLTVGHCAYLCEKCHTELTALLKELEEKEDYIATMEASIESSIEDPFERGKALGESAGWAAGWKNGIQRALYAAKYLGISSSRELGDGPTILSLEQWRASDTYKTTYQEIKS